METAVVIAFPDLSPIVDDWRERTSLDPPSTGMPAHVTLLFPFMPADRVDEETLSELRPCLPRRPPSPSRSARREGAHDTVVPHLTVAHGDDALLAEAESAVASALPIEMLVHEALLLEETLPNRARWDVRARFPLRSEPR